MEEREEREEMEERDDGQLKEKAIAGISALLKCNVGGAEEVEGVRGRSGRRARSQQCQVKPRRPAGRLAICHH